MAQQHATHLHLAADGQGEGERGRSRPRDRRHLMQRIMTRPIAVLLLVVWSCVYNARANYLLFDAVTDSVQIDGQTPYGGSFTFEAVVVFTPSHYGGGDAQPVAGIDWSGTQETAWHAHTRLRFPPGGEVACSSARIALSVPARSVPSC